MSYIEPSTPDILEGIELGEEHAAQRLASHCFERMIDIARMLIRRHGLPTVFDAEGAANAALYHFLTAPSKGKARTFATSEEFWQFTGLLIQRRLLHIYNNHRAAKRGGPGRTGSRSGGRRGEHPQGGVRQEDVDLDRLPSPVASHEAVVDGQSLVKKLIERLRDPSLREIAEKKLEGYTDEEVARATNQDVTTVKRKVREIGVLWEKWT